MARALHGASHDEQFTALYCTGGGVGQERERSIIQGPLTKMLQVIDNCKFLTYRSSMYHFLGNIYIE